jgi:hypothetical protein
MIFAARTAISKLISKYYLASKFKKKLGHQVEVNTALRIIHEHRIGLLLKKYLHFHRL